MQNIYKYKIHLFFLIIVLSFSFVRVPFAEAAAQCNDGIDNDNDGYTDYPADFWCTDTGDNDERGDNWEYGLCVGSCGTGTQNYYCTSKNNNNDCAGATLEPGATYTQDCQTGVACTVPVNGACSNPPIHNNCSAGTTGGTVEYPTVANPNLYEYQWWCNGSNGGSNVLCKEPKPNSLPIGSFDNASCGAGAVYGWARDTDSDPTPSSSNAAVTVQLFNGPASSGNLLAQLAANITREGAVGNHGFSWTAPQDGAARQIYAYAVDVQDSTRSTLLSVSPRGLTCALPPINGECSLPQVRYNCSAGTSVDNTETSTSWWWNCNGSNGGTNKSCSQPKPIDGECSLPQVPYNCSAGTTGATAEYPDASNPNLYEYQWWCNGSNGGTNKSCSQPISPPTPTCTSATPDGVDATGATHDVYINGVANATAAKLYVWSDINGQDDLWANVNGIYSAVNQGGGVWKATIPFSRHPDYGAFNVHVYMESPGFSGLGTWCDSANFTRNPPPPTPSGTLTGPSPCTIASGANSCNANLSWSITNPEAAPTAITASGMTNINVTNTLTSPQSGVQSVVVPAGNRTFFLYNNGIELAQHLVQSVCAAGTQWNGSTACEPIPPTMSGALIAAPSPCVIAENQSSCTTTLSWTVNNPEVVGGTIVSSSYPGFNTIVAPPVSTGTADAGTKSNVTVPFIGRAFFLYNNNVELDQLTVGASCVWGTYWDGTLCKAFPRPPLSLDLKVNMRDHNTAETALNVTPGEIVNFSWQGAGNFTLNCEATDGSPGWVDPSIDPEVLSFPFAAPLSLGLFKYSAKCSDDSDMGMGKLEKLLSFINPFNNASAANWETVTDSTWINVSYVVVGCGNNSSCKCAGSSATDDYSCKIGSGGSITIDWRCPAASTASVGVGFDTGGAKNGSKTLTPAAPTTYSVICNNGAANSFPTDVDVIKKPFFIEN